MTPTLAQEPSKEEEAGIAEVPSHGIAIDVPTQGEKGRPPNLRHMYSLWPAIMRNLGLR